MSRLLFAVAGVVLVGVAAGAVLLVLFAGAEVTPAADVGVNPAAPIDANNSPSVARNPRNPDNVVVAGRVDRPEFSAALYWSINGGAVWGSTPLPLPEGLDRPYAPHVSFDDEGMLHVAYVNLVGQGNLPDTLWTARSDDGGRTLSEPVPAAGELSFQPRITVDDGTIHLTYVAPDDVATLAMPDGGPIMSVRSDDGGQSWSEPVRVSDPDRRFVGAAVHEIDPASGDLVVAYMDFAGDVRDFQNLEGPPWDEPFELVVTRSTDGGETFAEGTVVDDRLQPTKRFLPFLPEYPSLAAGDGGALYLAWADGRNGGSDVFLSRSGDGGRSWGAPQRVNDNPADDGTWQYLPAVSVAPSGRVDLVFHDRRRDPDNVMTDAFLATSADGRAPFVNARISEESFDSRVGPRAAPHLEPDLGTQSAIDSTEDGALAVWSDTRLGDENTGRQDLVASQVAVSAGGGVLAWVLLGAGAVAGLAVAGAGWLVRRGASPDSPAGPDHADEPAADPAVESSHAGGHES